MCDRTEPPAQQPVRLRAGMVITTSARIAPGIYRLAAPASLDSAAIIIRGSNITVDFEGVVLAGSDSSALPDERAGVGIRIEGGQNVTIRNARVHGYQIGILARGTRNLSLLDNVVLRQLHHTHRPFAELRDEAAQLAVRFGLPGFPTGHPQDCLPEDLQRAACAGAFLGSPVLLLLEEPTFGVYPDLLVP